MAWKQQTPTSQYQEKEALILKANLKKFIDYLQSAGCTLKGKASEYEVLRYTAYGNERPKSGKPSTHVVYRKADGRISFTGDSFAHFNRFIANAPLPDQTLDPREVQRRSDQAKSTKERISWTKRTREYLRARDGDLCWYCHTTMYRPDGTSDVTIEHLLARHIAIEQGLPPSHYNHVDNLALAHAKCNRDAGHRPLDEKQRTREMYRQGLKTSVAHWTAVASPPPRTRIRNT